MSESAQVHQFDNGLTLVAEHMPWLKSVAFTLLVPAGTRYEPQERLGLGGVMLDLIHRGAGKRNSRQIVEDLDFMGVERSCSSTTFHSAFSVAIVAERLEETLALYADLVQRPHLPESELDEAKATAVQERLSIEDDPSQKAFIVLKEMRYGAEYGRCSQGTLEGIEAVTIEDAKHFFEKHYIPDNAILSVAGNFDWDSLKKLVEKLFGGWKPKSFKLEYEIPVQIGSLHIPHDSSQTHITLAYDCVPYQDPSYYQTRGLISVLSDGMSSRLFTEVREKRGLVYSVSASCQTIGNRGSVLTYAGTTGNRAQETLDVTLETIHSLGNGIQDGELSRLKSRVKSSFIMEQESSSSRSYQIAADWFYLGRVVPRQELLAKVESLTCESLLDHFNSHPPTRWALVSIGPEPVHLPEAMEFSNAI